MTLSLAFSCKKQSGKTTAGHFIMSLCMSKLGISKNIEINHEGNIVVSDLLGNKNYKGIYMPEKIDSDVSDYILLETKSKIDPYIQLYSFADPLKKQVCMDILGLTWEQCYGTDDDKNSLTDIRWEDMPEYNVSWTYSKDNDPSGYMTARQVMEHIGTDVFRRIKTNVWADATIRKINKERPKIAVITDCRFPNEVDAIKQNNGYVIRLTREPHKSEHMSENVLNKDIYDWSNFNYVIDNHNISIYDQCMSIQNALQEVLSL